MQKEEVLCVVVVVQRYFLFVDCYSQKKGRFLYIIFVSFILWQIKANIQIENCFLNFENVHRVKVNENALCSDKRVSMEDNKELGFLLECE